MSIPISLPDTGWQDEQAGYQERIVGPFRFSWSDKESDLSVAVFDRKTSECHPFMVNTTITGRGGQAEGVIPCKDLEDGKKVTKKIIETVYPGVFLYLDKGIRTKKEGES